MVKAYIFPLLIIILPKVLSEVSKYERKIGSDIQTKIEDYIFNEFLLPSNISDLSVAVVRNNGDVIYSAGFGFANHNKQIPLHNDTQILIGSLTKSFTSLLIVKILHEKFPTLGEKVLDTPIRTLAPNYNFVLSDRFRTEHVTFRDLLSHRVCLEKHDLQLLAQGVDSAKDIAFRQRYAKETCGIRTEFQYHNAMYILAGDVIAAIANSSYEKLVGDLLEEIGMLNSSLIKSTDDFSSMPLRALPHYVTDNVSFPINPELIKRVVPYNAAGGLFVTSNDMVKYMMLHLNGGKVGDKQVVPTEVMKWLTKSAIHQPMSAPYKMFEDDYVLTNSGYGLGLQLGTQNGYQYIMHTGYFPPYASQMSLYPGLKLGIFSSSSQGPLIIPHQVLHVYLMETLRESKDAVENTLKIGNLYKMIMFYARMHIQQKQAARAMFLEVCKNETQENITEIVGSYGSAIGGDLKIDEVFNEKSNNTGIYMRYGKWVKAWLEPIGGPAYKIIWDSAIEQDNHAVGGKMYLEFITVKNGTLNFYTDLTGTLKPWVSFQRGVSLDTLPKIPWKSGIQTNRSIELCNEMSELLTLFNM